MRKITAVLAVYFMVVTIPVQAQQAEEILKGLKAKWDQVQDYHCMMRSRNRLGDKKDEKKTEFWFKRPHQVRMLVTEGEKKGSTLTRDANGKIKGKTGGLLGVVSVTLGEDDERITNLRGRKFYLADWGSVLKEFFEGSKKRWKYQVLPDESFNNVACTVLEMTGKDASSAVTRDVIYVDKENNLILCRKQFEGNTLVNEVVWWDIQLNTGLGDDLFTL